MKIKLDDDFTLNSDRYCVWISKKRITKKGKTPGAEFDDNCGGWHRNIEDCFENFFQEQTRLSESTSITALRKEIKATQKRIKGWCEVLDKDLKLIRNDSNREL